MIISAEELNKIEDWFAPQFDADATHKVGELVMKDSLLYRCVTMYYGAWDSAKWTRTTLAEEYFIDVVLNLYGIDSSSTSIDIIRG